MGRFKRSKSKPKVKKIKITSNDIIKYWLDFDAYAFEKRWRDQLMKGGIKYVNAE